MVSSPTWRGAVVTVYAIAGLSIGFLVQDRYVAHRRALFDAAVDASVARALDAKERRVALLEAEVLARQQAKGPPMDAR